MKVDVSEIKTLRACERQWQLSSRNRFHLRSKVPAPALEFGTLFHESLAQLYLGVSIDKVVEMIQREAHPDYQVALLSMIKGYEKNIMPGDRERFKVLDIEHHFNIAPTTSQGEYIFDLEPVYDEAGQVAGAEPSLTICGSMDMVVLDPEQNKIYVFEHKTCKNFRDDTYLWMDEQPRLYTWAAKQYVAEYNERRYREWLQECQKIEQLNCSGVVAADMPTEPVPATLGGVYMNEVRKLLRKFEHRRTLCTYSDSDLDHFMIEFFSSCARAKHLVEDDAYAAPQPGYMTCQMCAYKSICSTYMYADLNKSEVVDEFSEEFEVRQEDHLEEKSERTTQ